MVDLLLNNQVLNYKLSLKALVFKCTSPGGFVSKIWTFSSNPQRKYIRILYFHGTIHASRVVGKQRFVCSLSRVPWARASCVDSVLSVVFVCFFVFLSAFFLWIGLGSWDKISSTYKVGRNLLNLQSMYFISSLVVLICRIIWFFTIFLDCIGN